MPTDEIRRTYTFGQNALNYIKKSEISAFPRNYELWYTYAGGFNTTLNNAINKILKKSGKVSADDVASIYNEILAPNRLGDQIEEVGGHVSDEISTIIEFLETSTGATEAYGESLTGAANKLKTTQNQKDLSALISNLVAETHDIVETNAALRDQLSESQKHVEELKDSLEAIRYETLTDELTTLANRKHFDQSLERAVNEAKNGDGLALLITDIDHFKKFNDTFGHQTGDQVLRLVAVTVKQNVKGQDIPCRYGGEEFAIILPNTNLKQAVTVAEHVREAVMSKELVKRSTGEQLGRVTISIGVAKYNDGDTPHTLIERADRCLYAAKSAGRNKVICETDPEMDDEAKNVA